jgi:hypothetical protein
MNSRSQGYKLRDFRGGNRLRFSQQESRAAFTPLG